MLAKYNIQTHKHKTLTSYMTSNEKIDYFDNQLKLRKHTVKSIYLIFIKNMFLAFSATLLETTEG